jgi:hypothetical protein
VLTGLDGNPEPVVSVQRSAVIDEVALKIMRSQAARARSLTRSARRSQRVARAACDQRSTPFTFLRELNGTSGSQTTPDNTARRENVR